jgi:cytoskeletal protein RodZ
LRRQREVREISLREIAESSKISIRYLEALEQDRFEILPATVFAKGFLREYANFVGLDPDEVINYFLAAQGLRSEEVSDDSPSELTIRTGNSSVWYLIAGVLAIFGLVAFLSWYLNRPSSESPDQPPAMAAPAVAESALPEPGEAIAPVAQSPITVTLDFTQNCWVEAFVDGERTRSELRVQGESLRFEASEEVRLTLGNVAGATMEINGIPYQPDVRDGEPMTVDLALAESLVGSSEAGGTVPGE